MRRFLSREPVIYLVFFACLVLLRCTYAVVMGQGVSTSDTYSYFEFQMWGNLRLYTVPIIYKALQETSLIVAFQILLSAVAWTTFTKSLVSKLALTEGKRFLTCLGIFSLASTTPVFVNDFFLMSESISLSLTLILASNVLNFLVIPSPNRLFWLCCTYSVWLYTKQAHVLIFLPTMLLIGILIFQAGRKLNLLPRLYAVGVLVLISATAVLQIRVENPISYWNTFAVMSMRLAKNPEWIEYFYSNGLPTNFISRAIDGSIDIGASLSVPSIAEWVNTNGISVYLGFMISYPLYTFVAPYLLPLVGGSVFLWSETFPAALFYSFKYFTFNVPKLPDNFSIWWMNTPREVFRNLFLYVLLLFEGLYRMFSSKKSLGINAKLSEVNKKLLFASFGFLIWVFLSGSIQWLFAPGDPTRIFLEQAVVAKLSLIVLACAIWFPAFQSSLNLKPGKEL